MLGEALDVVLGVVFGESLFEILGEVLLRDVLGYIEALGWSLLLMLVMALWLVGCREALC